MHLIWIVNKLASEAGEGALPPCAVGLRQKAGAFDGRLSVTRSVCVWRGGPRCRRCQQQQQREARSAHSHSSARSNPMPAW